MSTRRIMGLETEYGITLPGDTSITPMVLSGLVVRGYVAGAGPGAALPTGAGWDYADETPLRDARGFEMARALADVSQLTDVEDPTTANSVLANGARLYVDHAHPEYSSPEVTGPRDAVRWDRAGELVMLRAARTLAAEGLPVRLYKNNVDGKGASYGTHENYLLPRTVPFESIVRAMLPYLVARQVLCGAGRVGLGQASQQPGFQISQRADYIEADVGLETTLRRPLVNTRDEPHAAADRYRRLHVIAGDATLADVGTLLKTGVTSLVLRLVEDGVSAVPQLDLADPVAAVRQVSHDPAVQAKVELADGRWMTALDILGGYREAVQTALDRQRPGWEADAETLEVLGWWDEVTDRLRRDPRSCAGVVDWATKWELLERYRDRDGLAWNDPRLAAIDIQYSDLDPARGLAARMRAAGRLRTLVSDEDAEAAVLSAPADTRAWFRGACVRRHADELRAASWDSVVFALGRRLHRVSMPEPAGHTRAHCADLLERHDSAEGLLEAMGVLGSD
ncbi:depupylase/deamidase Dop [Ornithinicoccus halotolerans]|uniref:depupylase/deamidase Dop n=1 Tax=Ornithinicoccus halotolerans TaxID=1748220 RepID=UPI001294B7DF|nr:depupylase/deamidase Dop [Ornithinicoccus halotolerans]